jgi:uncharacterized protein YkvS
MIDLSESGNIVKPILGLNKITDNINNNSGIINQEYILTLELSILNKLFL